MNARLASNTLYIYHKSLLIRDDTTHDFTQQQRQQQQQPAVHANTAHNSVHTTHVVAENAMMHRAASALVAGVTVSQAHNQRVCVCVLADAPSIIYLMWSLNNNIAPCTLHIQCECSSLWLWRTNVCGANEGDTHRCQSDGAREKKNYRKCKRNHCHFI